MANYINSEVDDLNHVKGAPLFLCFGCLRGAMHNGDRRVLTVPSMGLGILFDGRAGGAAISSDQPGQEPPKAPTLRRRDRFPPQCGHVHPAGVERSETRWA